MEYILVKNKTTVLLGPTTWRQRFIQSEFDDLQVPYVVMPIEQGYINVDLAIGNDSATGLEIFPIVSTSVTAEPLYQELSGPFYNYTDNIATQTYNVNDLPLTVIKSNLKAIAANMRHAKENAGTTLVIKGTPVTLATTRAARINYADLLVNVTLTTIPIAVKFPNGFLTLDTTQLQLINTTIYNYVQAQFSWEATIDETINAAINIEVLHHIQSTQLTTPSNRFPTI